MLKTYRPLKNNRYNELEINVDYTLGGRSYFSDEITARGIYLYLTPVSRTGGFTSSTMLGSLKDSGFKIKLEELKRANTKKEQLHFSHIETLADEIAELYDGEKFNEILELVTDSKS